jgi:hypothetical protein
VNKKREKKKEKKLPLVKHGKNKVLYLPPQKRNESFYFAGSQKIMAR